MGLIVEDGTGLSDADSYETVEKADAYAAAFGRDVWAPLSTQKREIRMRLATQAIDTLWTYPSAALIDGQGLSFPRRALSVSGAIVQGVPPAVRKACLELATFPGLPSLLPPTSQKRVLSESKQIDGLRKSTTFADVPEYRHFWVAERLLAPFSGGIQSKGMGFGKLILC